MKAFLVFRCFFFSFVYISWTNAYLFQTYLKVRTLPFYFKIPVI